jgi:hypothetical protein
MARRRTLWPATKWTAAASSSAKQHVKRPRGAIGSDEQPAAKRARAPSSVQAVAFITCAENSQNFATNRDRRKLLQSVRNTLEAGAIIVNIAFTTIINKDKVDPGSILPELNQMFDKVWRNSVAQPAWSFRRHGNVMSFFSYACGALLSEKCLDPEGWLPAIMLTFDAPQGHLCIVNASVPTLPTNVGARMLETYVGAAEETGCVSILIGGAWQDTESQILLMEDQVTKMDLEFQFCSNANLCLLTHSSASKPVDCFAVETDGPYSLMGIWNKGSSVEPHASDDVCDSDAQPVKLKPHTPLWDGVILTLEQEVEKHENGEAFLTYMTRRCFFGKLLTMNGYGDEIETAVPLSFKMEEMMKAAQTQRDLQLERLRDRGIAWSSLNPAEYVMDPKTDMKEIYNTWRNNVESWMRPSTLTEYRRMQEWGENQQAHQLGKQAFSSYLFQVSGCKFLLHKLIEFPLISASQMPREDEDASAEQPAAIALNKLINAYEEHKKSRQYVEELRQSTRHQDDQRRLSGQVWWALHNHSQGRKLSESVRDNEVDFQQLPVWQQQMVEDYDCRRSTRALDEVLKQKAFKLQPYRGAGTETVG